MKNVMKKLAGLLMVLSVALFAGCSDSSDRANEAPQTAKTYTVSGKISIGNAVPANVAKSIASASEGASSNVRTATTDFDLETTTYEKSKTNWVAEAISVDDDNNSDNDIYIYGEIDPVGMTYSFKLPQGTWTLKLALEGEYREGVGGTLIYNEVEVIVEDNIEEDIILSPQDYQIYKNGALSLPITDGTTDHKIKTVTCALVNWTERNADDEALIKDSLETAIANLKKPKNFSSSGTVTIVQNDVPAGSYEATFTFKDENGNALYVCKEYITVFSGWTTDTWLGTSPYMQDGTFKITDALIEGYGTELVTASKNVLYETYSETTTVEGEDVTTTGYKYYLTENAESDISSLPATVTTSYSDKNSFCFDSDGNLYALDYDTQSKSYIISSTKYTDPIAIDGITNLKGITIDQTTNILYAYYGMQGTFELYKFANFISGTDENRKEYTIICDSSSDKSIDFYTAMNEELGHDNAIITIHGGILYGISQSNGGTRIDKMYKVDLSKETLVAEAVDLSKTSLSLSYNATYTDILYQDGAVYILVREVFDTNSRGALLRYDVVFGTVKTLFGPSDNADLSAVKLYTYYDDKQCYSDKELENKFNAPAKISKDGRDFSLLSTLYAPSPLSSTLSKEAFYGPVKFVAIKPRKLVIADDGIAFYTDTDGVLKYKNVNRIVTVDLENFAITESIETKVKFEKDTSDMKEIGNAGTVFSNSTGFQDVFESLLGTVFYTEDNTSTGIGSGDLNFAIPCGDTN